MENNENIKSDYEYSRDTYYEILEKGKESLELMIEVARESEHPRAFEVLSGMMKNMADINDKLMDLNKKNRDINEEPKQAQVGTTNNNLFIGSTTELQRFLQAEDDNNVIDMTPRLDDK
jgi:DNA-binding PadR family transcriptional regulator